MDTLKVADVLRKALEAFGPNGENWAQGDLPSVRFPHCCTVTAFDRIDCGDVRRVAERFLRKAIPAKERPPSGFISEWNDWPGRTFADVKALYERAIADAEATHA